MVSLWVIVSKKNIWGQSWVKNIFYISNKVWLRVGTHSCILHLHRLPVSSIVESSLIVYGSPETPWLFSHPQSNLLKSWNDPSLLKWYPALVLMGKDLLFSEIDTNTESEHMILFVICWRECRRTLHPPRFRVRFGTVFFRHTWLKCLTELVFSVIYVLSQ